jgi:hypothetical protein
MLWEQICDREEQRADEQICITKLVTSFFNFANTPKNGMGPETGNLGTVFLFDSYITSTLKKKSFSNMVPIHASLFPEKFQFLSPDLENSYPNWYAFALFSPTKQIFSENLKTCRNHILKRLADKGI